MGDYGDALPIPAAQHEEQARLEAEIFLNVCRLGGLSAHPLDIVSVRPEPHQLTIRLLDEPYVIRHWAEFLLPRTCGEDGDDPHDRITGVAGLGYRRGAGIVLHFPNMPTRVLLTGFNPRWWDRHPDTSRRTSVPRSSRQDRPLGRRCRLHTPAGQATGQSRALQPARAPAHLRLEQSHSPCRDHTRRREQRIPTAHRKPWGFGTCPRGVWSHGHDVAPLVSGTLVLP